MLHTLLHGDTSLFLLVNNGLANPILDAFFVTITNGRFWIIPGIAAVIIYLIVEKKNGFLVLGLALVTVTFTDQFATGLIKPLVHRLRPCDPNALVEGGRFLIGFKSSFSFPSNHAMNMFGQAMLLTFFYPKFGAWFFTFASLIGFSRIYVGIHYPLDVVGGALLGVACGAAVWGGYRGAVTWRRTRKNRGVPPQHTNCI